MSSTAIFWLQVLVSVGVVTLITVWYVWPRLVTRDLNSALVPLLFVNVFRFVGMGLLVKGMVDPRLLMTPSRGPPTAISSQRPWRSAIFALRRTGVSPFLWFGWPTSGDSWTC